jgi:hypothetical protein
MSYRPKALTHYQRSFVLSSGFLAAGAFVVAGRELVTERFPAHCYVFYVASLCICLQGLVRYFIVARVFQTEKNLNAWSVSMAIALLGPMTVYMSLSGPGWFLFVVILLLLANLKTSQAKKAIAESTQLAEGQKAILSRVQSGLLWFQSYCAAIMLSTWVATIGRLGEFIAKGWFGVSDTPRWIEGVSVAGGSICLLFSAHLAVRVLSWHRDYLRISGPPIAEVERVTGL